MIINSNGENNKIYLICSNAYQHRILKQMWYFTKGGCGLKIK